MNSSANAHAGETHLIMAELSLFMESIHYRGLQFQSAASNLKKAASILRMIIVQGDLQPLSGLNRLLLSSKFFGTVIA